MNPIRTALTVLLSLLLLSASCLAAEESDRPRIGLALSGGGARGGAHVGVLKVIEELGVPIDYVAGTSMGAIVGALYAIGYPADGIERLLGETNWERALTDQPDRRDRTMRKKENDAEFLIPYRIGFNGGQVELPLGAVEGQHLDQLFHKVLLPVVRVHEFDQLHIPFRAVATDLVTGEEVVLSNGSLPDALRASMSVPGVFAPVRINGRLLVDGGMSNNLPVSVVREMGADIVIAVDISSPLLKEEDLKSVVNVTEQLTNFLTRRSTEKQIASLGSQDVLIVPELGDFGSIDLTRSTEVITLGAKAAYAVKGELEGLARFAGGSDRAIEPPPSYPDASDDIVEFVEIVNNSVLNDELIRSRLAVKPGEPLDLQALDHSVDQIYSLDVFESVTYDMVQNSAGQHGVRVTAEDRSWGPNYMQFGLELSNDFSGNSDFKIGAGYTRNALNSLGGELRVLGSIGREDELRLDFYQPIDPKARWFVNPKIRWERRTFDLWVEDQRFAEFEITGWSSWLGLGRNLSTTDQVRLDYEFGRSTAQLITGLPLPYDDQIDIGELVLSYRHDSLDSLYFPTSGMLHELTYLYADDKIGAYSDYEQARAVGYMTMTSGRNTALLYYELGYSFDDEAPLERWYQLGGFGRISGMVPNQLSGRHEALATLSLYRQLNEIDVLPVYAGVTLEAGNAWEFSDNIAFDDLIYAGSVFVGAETPLGPVYLGVGYNDRSQGAVYFYVGNPFKPKRID
ncbi:MAG: patatin-like phospholipase family protein [Lysobacterales bacterium]